jgi:hypothetical protein
MTVIEFVNEVMQHLAFLYSISVAYEVFITDIVFGRGKYTQKWRMS